MRRSRSAMTTEKTRTTRRLSISQKQHWLPLRMETCVARRRNWTRLASGSSIPGCSASAAPGDLRLQRCRRDFAVRLQEKEQAAASLDWRRRLVTDYIFPAKYRTRDPKARRADWQDTAAAAHPKLVVLASIFRETPAEGRGCCLVSQAAKSDVGRRHHLRGRHPRRGR